MNKARTNGNMNGNGMNGMGGMNNMNGTNGNGTNGMNNMGGMNGRVGGVTGNGGALSGSLAEQIRALGFVKTELELYLDTHPRCRTALDYYYRTIQELNRLVDEYQNTVGPLTAAGVMSNDDWTWVQGPWPWQQAGDFMREGDR